MAAFMACAHAKFTGEVGVCLATSGPGAIHLLNGLYDAKLDHQPVVAIVGQQKRAALGGNYQQEVDLISLFKDVAHEYVHMVSTPMQMRHMVDRAMRIAQAERNVCCIIIPNDIQEMTAEKPAREHGTIHSGIGYQAPRVVPRAEDLQRAADVLNAGSKVAMLVGAGALSATDEVIEAAELLGAGIAKALLGKAAVPDDLPYRHRLHRPAGHQAELGHDDGVRHPADDRIGLSLFRISARRRPGARRANRHQRPHDKYPLSDGSESGRR